MDYTYRQNIIIEEIKKILNDMDWIIDTGNNILQEKSKWVLTNRGKDFIKCLNGDYDLYKNIIIDNQKYLNIAKMKYNLLGGLDK